MTFRQHHQSNPIPGERGEGKVRMRTPGIMPDYSLAAVAVFFSPLQAPQTSCGLFLPSPVGDENRFLRILGRWQPHRSSFEILETAERSWVANDSAGRMIVQGAGVDESCPNKCHNIERIGTLPVICALSW
jgi:hypothetical protein